MHCEGTLCTFDEPPPGSLGTDCTGPDDCSTGICEAGFCTKECDLSVGLFCPAGFECDSTNQVDYYCQPSADGGGGGCSTSSDNGGAFLALLGLLAISLRRRRLA
jgi:uncharacterized protein (TIGR03382 family)